MKRRFLPRILKNNNNKKKLSFQDTILTYNLQKKNLKLSLQKIIFAYIFFFKEIKTSKRSFLLQIQSLFPNRQKL